MRVVAFVIMALMLAGCESVNSPPVQATPDTPASNEIAVPLGEPKALTTFTRSLIAEVRANRPEMLSDSEWITTRNQGDVELMKADRHLNQSTPTLAPTLIGVARALYASAELSGNATYENSGSYLEPTQLTASFHQVAGLVNATRRGGVTQDGLAYLVLSERAFAQAAEMAERHKEAVADAHRGRAYEDVVSAILRYQYTDSLLWVSHRLAAEAEGHPGKLAPATRSRDVVDEALALSARLPGESRTSDRVSVFVLAKTRMPQWINTTLAYDWSEGSTELALNLLAYARAAPRIEAGDGTATRETVSQLMSQYGSASRQGALDDWHLHQVLDTVRMAHNEPSWYILAEELVRTAPERRDAHTPLGTAED